MVNRTAEKVLTWIGNGLHALSFLMFGVLLLLLNFNSTEFKQSMLDSETTMADANGVFIVFNVILIVGLIVAIIFLALGILSALLIGKKNKAAGIILIVIGVFSLFGNALVGVLWIVAGIMLLVRKPRSDIYSNEPHAFESFNLQQQYDYETKDGQQNSTNNVDDVQKKKDPYKY
ncbi:DUF4064 domain-containing protein [Staphylococcus sp. ACRSN]|uniref:DUF4064 domain-containing protein n=1 Tax=Staphylococcus sp. ACRSN TaxID=2918214 RepID=UPI001EF1D355|nr:DUF4064 domain-containing protein [Staphylococcus sp. ACRSN]MCG7338910.1 DUF4064 domain-containing protein [Staphylococcus sp. ACRSN]